MHESRRPYDAEFLAAVQEGLRTPPRTLPCRFFYDREGSLLFEAICLLPEYYLTRAEDAILSERADEIAGLVADGSDLIELGSGSSAKTRRLLEAFLRRRKPVRYIPVDISESMLRETAAALCRDYAGLTVSPITAEYQPAMERLAAERSGPRLVSFLGSNLGNFTPPEALTFLRRLRAMLDGPDRVLLGLDLQKDAAVLEAAYDDAAGVTARFNLNLLARINRELDGTFDGDAFSHLARYNPEEGRIEMHLVSCREQTAAVAGELFHFRAGETIHTENSYKYSLERLPDLVGEGGLRIVRTWCDANGLFSLNLLAPN